VGPAFFGVRDVNILDRFEQSFERLVEGSIGRVFRSSLQPAEIGRKLERAMIDKQVVSVGSILVPNEYQVSLHPDDMAAFADFKASLCREMENWLTNVAGERNFTMIDRPRVQISSSDKVPRRAIHVTSTISDRVGHAASPTSPAQRTEIYRFARPHAAVAPNIRLRIVAGPDQGRDYPVGFGVTTIGRAPDNDLVLDSHNVSRRHARIEHSPGEVRVIDLQSTNGTSVNGARVTEQVVRPGDQITFGTTTVRVVSSNGLSH
jgi:pSer/pThr/pTyr-binding forkhead associated (FHA) protein